MMSELREAFETWFLKEFPIFEGSRLVRTETGYQGAFTDATYVAFKAGVEWKAQQAAVPCSACENQLQTIHKLEVASAGYNMDRDELLAEIDQLRAVKKGMFLQLRGWEIVNECGNTIFWSNDFLRVKEKEFEYNTKARAVFTEAVNDTPHCVLVPYIFNEEMMQAAILSLVNGLRKISVGELKTLVSACQSAIKVYSEKAQENDRG